jgi:hypothetical protein
VVVDVLVAKRKTEDPLRDQLTDIVLDTARVAVIHEAVCELLDDRAAPLDLLQKQHARIRGDVTAVELGANLASTWPLEHRPASLDKENT